MISLYFGCGPRPGLGHHFFLPSGKGAGRHWSRPDALPFGHVDGQLAPRIGRDGLVRFGRGRDEEAPQGAAWLHNDAGWTALSYWDRSVDHRGSSNSTFLFDETLDFDAALARARDEFPWVFERQAFEVVPLLEPAASPKTETEETS